MQSPPERPRGTTPGWQFWIDRGGTFTDVVGQRPDGSTVTAKLLSDNPEQYEDAALAGIRRLLGVLPDAPLPVHAIDAVKMGTTVATNALLERRGEPTLLVITRGFRDQLRIGYQNRPKLFERHIVLPELLYTRVVEAVERIDARGVVRVPLDEAQLRRELEQAHAAGLSAVAIVFMHGFQHTAHEARAAQIARSVGFTQVSVSHEVSPLMKLVSRGDTTVVDAYLSPILGRYVARVARELVRGEQTVPLSFMKSDGGLTDAATFRGKDAIVSGPAGGIVGMVQSALAAGFSRVIGFDMGGTSTDVSHFSGHSLADCEREFETQVAGVRLRAPMMAIHTIAAGGGSILHFDGQKFRVGPESSGANPGPTCYRRGGPLSLTDCNVMLGRIQPEFFPRVFGTAGDLPLDREAVVAAFAALSSEVSRTQHKLVTPEQVAAGFLRIAVASMANAIKFISVQRGYDVTGYTLCCFGGAGGQHACLVADELGIERIFVHAYAGVLSALGMGLADVTAMREHAFERGLTADALEAARGLLAKLAAEARSSVLAQGVAPERIVVYERVHVKYAGTDTALVLEMGELESIERAFEAAYRQRFSFLMPGRDLIIEAVSTEVVGRSQPPKLEEPVTHARAAEPCARAPMFVDDAYRDAPVFLREQLSRDQRIEGPAIIAEANATTLVDPGWRARLDAGGQLVLERYLPRPTRVALGTEADPVMLEVFNNLFMSIAEQMGVRLANTAHSVNIKERLDFSCALFDRDGNLIANAPHMPVHLGSMGASIKSVIRKNRGRMRKGDVFALNDPYNGGTHLPDVTVVMPVFVESTHEPLFYVAARGHHADIGGLTPGSMPPASRTIDEEGVLLDNFKLVEGGRLCEAELHELLTRGPYPARNPAQNLADLRAQVAACEKGREELDAMVAQFGLDAVKAYMGHVQDNAEESVRRAITALCDGEFETSLDCGAVIRVRVQVDQTQRSATVDFTGTSPQLPNNFNAPEAVVHAAVLYVFRTLVDADIPMNAGCLKPITLIIPEGCLLSPRPPAATVAGNVETSQVITDALYGALGVMASSQGTMNNFTFGNDRYQYYETVAGGSGAGDGFAGTAAVQTHMTNSRMTDPEVLEHRFPVLVEEHAIRHGSGGKGRFNGGDGARRRVRFLEPMHAAILAGRRSVAPFGMHGGGAGEVGRTFVERASGERMELAYAEEVEMQPSDVFVISTPSGGAYGAPE